MYNTSSLTSSEIITNYHKVCDRIKVAAESVDRDYNEICLVVVTKTFDPSVFIPLIDIGHKDFGENKVQDMVAKYQSLPKNIRWHMIGHLQRNKVKDIIEFIHLIHSVDSFRLIDHINKLSIDKNIFTNILIQVKISN